MEAITYKHLLLKLGETALSVENIVIKEEPGRHGILSVDASAQEEIKDYLLYEEDDRVVLNAVVDNTSQPLFYGIVTRMAVKSQSGRCEIHLEAVTESYLMDITTKNRSFQDTAMTSHQLVNKIMESYCQSQVLFSIPDRTLNQIMVQYQETDWAFLNRLLSAYGSSACIASNKPGICLRAGLMDTEEDAEWDSLPYVLQRDTAPKDEGKGLKGQLCYRVEAYDLFPLGEKVRFRGQDLYIGKIERNIAKGLLVSRYHLYFEEGVNVRKYYNPFLSGASIYGRVLDVNRDKVQVRLETDALIQCKKKYDFPFSSVAASPDGSGWYCMPRVGDQVRIFFPTENESEGYAITSIQGVSAPAKGSSMGNPDLKDITMPDGKAVRFIKDGIQLSVGEEKGTVTLTNDGKAEIKTKEDIEIYAANELHFTAKGAMIVTAGTKIQILNDAGGNISMTEDAVEIDAFQIRSN